MSVLHLEDKLATIRAGKANVHILDAIRVNSYGSMVGLNAVASVTTPDARTIAIKPWDKSMFHPIEKAIIDSEVGIMPENNGEVIRLAIPHSQKSADASSRSSAERKPKRRRWQYATLVATVSTN